MIKFIFGSFIVQVENLRIMTERKNRQHTHFRAAERIKTNKNINIIENNARHREKETEKSRNPNIYMIIYVLFIYIMTINNNKIIEIIQVYH